MKNILLKTSCITFILLSALLAEAQTGRYINEVFNSVTVTTNVQYAQNMSVFPGPGTNLIPLTVDVYEPTGDILPVRPLILLMHTGSYLPIFCNGTPSGSKNDSATVELAMQFTRRGYVVANMDYRIGWNPASSSLDVRRGTLLQAVYRSIQDAKSCVRFFRADYETGNQFKIDTSMIILGGQGTGGYIALNYISLDKPSELNIPKLLSGITDPNIPLVAGQSYINQTIHGDFEGYGGIPQLNYPNNSVGYSSKVHFAFNLGGALGDSTWIEPGDVPTVAFHVIGDPYAPYNIGTVFVPGNPPQAVIDVAGSRKVLDLANLYGNNDCFANYTFTDVFTNAANNFNDGLEGLFPFNMDPATQSGPWEWWDSLIVIQSAPLCGQNGLTIHMNALGTNPDMSKQKALAYIDTVMGYLNPRIVKCLMTVGLEENTSLATQISVSPNPSSNYVKLTINSNEKILFIEIFDIIGKQVKEVEVTGEQIYTIDVHNLNRGSYFIRLGSANGAATKKLMLQ